MARDISIARQVRPLVGWTQWEGLRIPAELIGMAVGWRPARPAAYITAVLAQDRGHEVAAHYGQDPDDAPDL
ncbi:hypothetical protein OHT61_17510 [Streptomyces sp. NBC_00178]|uniref:hypothetical protein n=1 Tax=Streptomyces sp. NBC_00178 TaxID=2975672 RepID=UPI002E2BD70F|nr:hypothetical protein [Streptomyces sp. NBC_00178]